jgi:prepilin-type N-terminal cleavage/methylation domain-containing protein
MVPRPDPRPAGFTILELLFTLAIAGTLAATAVPLGLRTLDDFRTRSAARYLAARLADARIRAVRRSYAVGLRFQPASPDYLVAAVADGNGNGIRSAEVERGIDRTVSEAEAIGWHFTGVSFGILENVPDADGQPANGSDGVRVGAARLLSMAPDGSSSSGTLYLHGTDRSQYAVRVLGATGRIRLLKYDFSLARWVNV